MISFGLIFATRLKSEELASGLMNLITFPMIIFSGVFFSLKGMPRLMQNASKFFPLTYFIEASRAVMIDGAGIVQILPNILSDNCFNPFSLGVVTDFKPVFSVVNMRLRILCDIFIKSINQGYEI